MKSSQLPLSQILCAPLDATTPVSFCGEVFVTRAQWLQKITQWQTFFSQHKEQRWALYHPNAADFSCILFALWASGKEVFLPGSLQSEALAELATQVDAFVGEFAALASHIDVVDERAIASIDTSLSQLTPHLDTSTHCLWIYTSGSSGAPQAIPKTLYQLEQELAHLQQQWSDSPTAAAVISTVSHQHIYGLLFRVLLPLVNQWPFDALPCEFIEQFEERSFKALPLVIISSPTHLSRTPEQKARQHHYEVAMVFSSGAPLQREHSLAAQALLEAPVFEVYGSSETGGIAWRQQSAQHAALWQTLPGVDIQQNAQQCLRVKSAHLSDENHWYDTADRIRITRNQHFELLGRIDNIVKVEGKRVSMQAVESQLLQHPWANDVKCLLLETRRTEIAAVVVLSNEGQSQLDAHGKRHVNLALQRHLMQFIERAVTPRRWRYVSSLPYNAQGKLTLFSLKSLFMSHTQPPKFASEVKLEVHGGTRTLELFVPQTLLYFDGHFDNTPILPGVVQVQWAEHYAKREFGEQLVFQGLTALKFQQVVVPEQTLTLSLDYNREKNYVKFAFQSDRGQHSSGKMMIKGNDE